MILFDSHIHTLCSSDGRLTASEQAEAALEKGLNGICITDHFEPQDYDQNYDFDHIKRSIEGAKKAKQEYEGRIEVTSGIELGEYIFEPNNAQRCLKTFDFDFILCSVHSDCVGKTIWDSFQGFRTFNEFTSVEDNIFMKESHIVFTTQSE